MARVGRGLKKDGRAGLSKGKGGDQNSWPGVTLVGERIMAKDTKEAYLTCAR